MDAINRIMSTPVTAVVRDGLGNQLFIVVTALAYARRHGRPALFRRDAAYGYRAAYWDSMLAHAPTAAPGSPECAAIEAADRVVHQEAAHSFAEIPAGADTLAGFFQSARYFDAEFAAVAADLRLTEMRAAVRAKCINAFTANANANTSENASEVLAYDANVTSAPTTISVHFRLGDYKWHASHVLRCNYYAKAIAAACANIQIAAPGAVQAAAPIRVLYFYELEDQAIIDNWIAALRDAFSALEFVAARLCISSSASSSANALADWEEMLLMSCCDHHVIANSSFSWWAAYLGRLDAPRGVVCAPRQWFGTDVAALARSRDICPADWLLIDD